MNKTLIIFLCMALVQLCVSAQPVAETDTDENTASPAVTTEQKNVTKEEKKSLNDFVITEPQFPGIITTEEKEKKE